MFFSKGAQYAVKAMLDVASVDEGVGTTTREVAERQNIPGVFLSKIVQSLVHAGLLRAYRGASGGIMLARSPSEINLRQVIEAIDGPIAVSECLLNSVKCPEESVCFIHPVWVDLCQKVIEYLEASNLADLSKYKGELLLK